MKRHLIVIICSLLPLIAMAQMRITGTVTDANGQTATVSYCLVGDDLKYVVTDAAEGRTIVEYRVTSTTVDQNLFNIPADYQILTQAEFEAAQANH